MPGGVGEQSVKPYTPDYAVIAAGLTAAGYFQPFSLPPGAAAYQVMPNKTIRGPDGKRFVINGITDFFALTIDQWTDSGYHYPKYAVAGKGAGTGISEPTYQARLGYRTAAWRATEWEAKKRLGINFVRFAVEVATMNTPAYTDPVDGLPYPSEEEMMDTIVNEAEDWGMVIQIVTGNDYDNIADTANLLRWLAGKYWNRPHVWIATKNEPRIQSGLYGDHNNALDWANEHATYMLALREDIPGQPAGTKYTNPICLDVMFYTAGGIMDFNITRIKTYIDTWSQFTGDDNWLFNTHWYPLDANASANFRTVDLPLMDWVQYVNTYCIIINEFGHNSSAFTGRLDPNLDAGIPSVDLTKWANNQLKVKECFAWAKQLAQETSFSGSATQEWGRWMTHFKNTTLNQHDNNSLRRYDSSGDFIEWSTTGIIFRDIHASPPVQNDMMILRTKAQLNALVTAGGWMPQIALCSDSSGANNPELVVYKSQTLGWRLVSTGAAI